MSLGWQTESALLPSKAKPISVDGKSLVSLKAIVFSQEKKSSSSNSNLHEKHRLKSSSRDKDPMLRSNPGIEARKNKDAQLSLMDVKSSSSIEASLRAKAKLYDEMITNKNLANSATSSFLVNFQEKDVIRSGDEDIAKTVDRSHDDDEDEEMVDIIDSFGRSRRVKKRSAEYSEYFLDQATKKYKSSLVPQVNNHSSTASSGPWAWSTGHDREDAGEWIDEAVKERGLKSLIEDRVAHEVNESSTMSKAARVKTMWEKTLDSSAREYIDEIHNQVESHRQQQDLTARSSEANQVTSSANLSEEDKRRDLIRRKLEERKSRQSYS